jgi:hypothetical protein
MKKLGAAFIIGLLLSVTAKAEVLKTEDGKITKIYSHDDHNDGDVYIPFSTGLADCPDGVYLSPQSPGFKTMVSFALTAYTSNKTVQFQVYSDQIWNGSSSKNCKVDTVILK